MKKTLLKLGFNPTKGLYYLERAIKLKLKEPDIKTCALYFIVAKEFKTNAACVERSIRYCIRTSNTIYKNMKMGMAINSIIINLEEELK